MTNDLINALKRTSTSWDSLDDELSYPVVTGISAEYLRRALSLIKRWETESKRSYDDTYSSMVAFGNWLRDVQRLRINPDSWRSYRYQCIQALPYADFKSLIDVPPATKKRDLMLATSRYRQKHLKEHALNILKRHFSLSRSPLAVDIIDILVATLHTGLRPSEWAHAELKMHEGHKPFLWVKNAKKGTRLHQIDKTHRPVPLGHLDESHLNAVKITLTRFRAARDPGIYQEQLKKVLGSAVRACFYGQDSRPSLYSARHQYAANLKASGIAPELIAVVMGHVDDATQSHHYGREVNGKPIMISAGDIEELSHAYLQK